MTPTEHRPGVQHRGDVNDQHRAGTVNEDRTWSTRHRRRVDHIFTDRNSWTGGSHDWTDRELHAWAAAADHLRAVNLYGRWQIPESARAAWRCHSCPCHRDAA